MESNLDRIYNTYKNFYVMFIGTNDYELQINDVTNIITNYDYDYFYGVSGSWMMILSGIRSKLKGIVLYDYNPLMLLVYNFIYNVIKASDSRKEFITNMFSRKLNNDLLSNEDVLSYLNQPVDYNIKNNLIEKLKEYKQRGFIAIDFINRFYDELILGKDRIVYPSFYWEGKSTHKGFEGKKFRTQKNTKIFNTFYYDIVYCFKFDKYYDNLKRILEETPINFKHINFNDISSSFLPKNDKILLYMSNIDSKYPIYLNMHRDDLRKKIQNIVRQNNNKYIHLLSTVTYLTKITANNMEFIPNKNFSDISKRQYYNMLKEKTDEKYLKKIIDKSDVDYIEKILNTNGINNNENNATHNIKDFSYLYYKYKSEYLKLKKKIKIK